MKKILSISNSNMKVKNETTKKHQQMQGETINMAMA